MLKYARIKENNCDELDGLTEGKWYKVLCDDYDSGFDITDDNGNGSFCRTSYCAHLGGGSWELKDFDHDPNETEKPEWCSNPVECKIKGIDKTQSECWCEAQCGYHKEPLMTFFEAWQKADDGSFIITNGLINNIRIIKGEYRPIRTATTNVCPNQGLIFEKIWHIEPKAKPEPKSVNVVEMGGDCVSSFYGKCGKLEQLTLNVPNGISTALTIKKIIIEYED